jgi:hypothetical protein
MKPSLLPLFPPLFDRAGAIRQRMWIPVDDVATLAEQTQAVYVGDLNILSRQALFAVTKMSRI